MVSVIMPAYNMEKYIEEAVRSVIAQTYEDWELLIIDDGSIDDTVKIAEEIAKEDNRIYVLKNEKNMGVAYTRNRGLDSCKGDLAALLDSDDYWDPKFLEKSVELENKTNADFVYCSYGIVNEQGGKICNDFIVPKRTCFEDFLVKSVISCSTVLFSKKMVREARFPVDVYHEDLALWLKMLKKGAAAYGITEVLAFYRQSNNTRNNNKIKSAARRWIIYRDYLGLSLFESAITMVKYAYCGFQKYKKCDKK
ncbi:MAG: glycosyltransferase [Oscillospiraceae bacterium]|nr:glycosyltransferase [Oscillospiraceae bacterium]